jgi:hypothetical protein
MDGFVDIGHGPQDGTTCVRLYNHLETLIHQSVLHSAPPLDGENFIAGTYLIQVDPESSVDQSVSEKQKISDFKSPAFRRPPEPKERNSIETSKFKKDFYEQKTTTSTENRASKTMDTVCITNARTFDEIIAFYQTPSPENHTISKIRQNLDSFRL